MRSGMRTGVVVSAVVTLLLIPVAPVGAAEDAAPPTSYPTRTNPAPKDNATPPAPTRKQARALAATESSAPNWAGTPAPEEGGGVYVLGSGADIDRYIGANDGPFRATFEIPYTPGKYDAAGHLLPTDPRYGKTATLALDVYDVDSEGDYRPPEEDEVLFNGQPATNTDGTHFLTGKNDTFNVNVLTIPMSAVVFPRSKTKTANNTVQINMDIRNDAWAATVGWIKLDVTGNIQRPILLVHGLNGNADGWGPLEPPAGPSRVDSFTGRLRNAGFTGKFYEPQLGRRDSQESNEPLLAKEADRALAETGSPQVDIIAHSKGGLDSRNYIVSNPDAVAHLVMVATPNGGSPGADLICFVDQNPVPWLVSPLGEAFARDKVRTDFGPCDSAQDAVYDLQQWWVQDVFNPITPDQPQVSYSVIAGNIVPWIWGLWGAPGVGSAGTDLLVPVDSAFWLQPSTGPDDWHPGLQKPVHPVLPYGHSGLIDEIGAPTATLALCQIYPTLPSCSTVELQGNAEAGDAAERIASMQEGETPSQVTITGGYSVPVQPGQTATVPSSELSDAQRVTLFNQPESGLRLLNGGQPVGPDGQIDPAQPLSVTNDGVSPVEARMVFAGVPSQILTLQPDNSFPESGTTAKFTATLTGEPVGTAPTFTTRRGDGTVLVTAAMTADPDQPNTWHTNVDVALPSHTRAETVTATAMLTQPALRYAMSGVAVTTPAQFPDPPHGTYVDKDSDGTLDTLQVEFALPTGVGGCGPQYRLSLTNQDGAPVATRVGTPCSTDTVRVEFPITALGEDSGPFQMNTLVAAQDDDIFTVATNLGELPAVPENLSVAAPLSIRPGSMSPAWVDSDGDRKLDALALTGTFTAPAEGDYEVTVGPVGDLEAVTGTVHLSAGLSQQTVVIPEPIVMPASPGAELTMGPVSISPVGQPELSAINTAWQYLPPVPASVIKALPPKSVTATVDGNTVTVRWAPPAPGQTVSATVTRVGEGAEVWQPSETTETSATFTDLPWHVGSFNALAVTHSGRASSFPTVKQFQVRPDLKVKLAAAPATVVPGTPSTLTATVTGTKPSGIGKPISLWSSSNDWSEPVASATVDPAGKAAFPVSPDRSTAYWVDLPYSDDFGASSNTVIVKVKPTLTLKAPSGYVSPDQAVTLTGSTSLPAGKEISIERRDGTTWISIETVTVNEHGAFTPEIITGTVGTFYYRARYLSNGEWSDYATATSTTATVRAR